MSSLKAKKKKEDGIPVVEAPVVPPLALEEFDVVIAKQRLPFFSTDKEQMQEQAKNPEKCPMVEVGSYMWVDSLVGDKKDIIRLHPMNVVNTPYRGIVFVGVAASGAVLHKIGEKINHPDRWKKYGKVVGWILLWGHVWARRFSRAWDALRGR
jgi:hypothetical protein